MVPHTLLQYFAITPLAVIAANLYQILAAHRIQADLDCPTDHLDRLFEQAWYAFDQDDFAAALDTFQTLLVWQQHLNCMAGIEATLNCVAFVEQEMLHKSKVESLESLFQGPAAADTDDDRQQALQLATLGGLHRRSGRPQEAIACYQEAIKAFRSVGEIANVGLMLNNLGTIYAQMGQHQRTQSLCLTAVSLLADSSDRHSYATALHNLGVAYYHLSNYHQALKYLEQALALRGQLGDRAGEASTLSYMGKTYCHQHLFMYALSCYEAALELCQTPANALALQQKGTILGHLAALSQQTGHPQLAVSYYEQALEIFATVADDKGAGRIFSQMGKLFEYLGKTTAALDCYQQALGKLRDMGDRLGEVATLDKIEGLYQQINSCSLMADFVA
ncbi:MAG: tetratricopeptide repeat protein [Leptolyngbyaceae cyanobacterium SM1_1_3]|nr:tetratricopeptide repeat protein [Leptolyngbyaceae cyanobacterium SM1_1_3]NJN02737.1 tetratricopeptide repeat protein [Leptolyngbyaceae cyanobacterium RM1_1_2]NJO09285.1 tetratricopeptide repeat protein [Leptolyngbyaceae cyanobacterium SL_1_1]